MSLINWIDDRFPLTKVWNEHLAQYYAPKNFNFWYYFGGLAVVVLVLQIVTGIILTMHYKPDAELAFASVEYIMRDVPAGWFVRYLHGVGASMFFLVVYLHMFRGLMYGSYRNPRELIWILGMVIYVALMAEAFSATYCHGAICRTGERRSLFRCLARYRSLASHWRNGFAGILWSLMQR